MGCNEQSQVGGGIVNYLRDTTHRICVQCHEQQQTPPPKHPRLQEGGGDTADTQP